MATYKEIFGKQVKFLSSDPANEAEGQIWYNSTSDTFKTVLVTEAWSSGSSMITARRQVGGFGTQTAAVVVCGQNPPALATAEEYNGSGWTAITANPEVRVKPFATGIETAGLVGGGESGPSSGTNAGEWNGTAWGTPTTIPQTMYDSTAFGPEAAAVCIAGSQPPTTGVLLYDGSTWTSGTVTPTQMLSASASGVPTAGFVFGDYPGQTQTLEYASGTWTAGGVLNTGRDRGAAGLNGTLTSTIYFGGNSPPITELTATESYDGTSWTTSPASLATARRGLGGAGTGTLALAFGGYTGSDTAVTEEFNRSANVITAGAWAAGDNINTSRSQMAGGGTMTAGWIAGGLAPGFSNATEEYNGSTWSSVNNYGEAARLVAGSGPQATAFATGGFTAPSTVSKATYDYDGTNWTASVNQPDTHYGQGAAGTQTAGFICGGSIYPASTYVTTTFEYDGTYSVGGTMATARQYIAGAGTQTAAVMTTGNMPALPYVSNATEEYNSGVWSTTGNNLFTVRGAGMSGSQTAGLSFGGSVDPGSNVLTTTYDGAVWATNPNIATSRGLIGGSKEGTQGSAWMCGGLVDGPGAHTNATEEFTGETSAVNIETLTTS
jgi:hypothetical protein